jgi:hypothetical protein
LTFYRENAIRPTARRAGDPACQVGAVADPTFSSAGAIVAMIMMVYEGIISNAFFNKMLDKTFEG